jgi:hypothetical protein
MYGDDGSFGEGVSYWGYTTLHLALFAEVLWRTRASTTAASSITPARSATRWQ